MSGGVRDDRPRAFFWLTPFATRQIRSSTTNDDPSLPSVFAVYLALCELANEAHARTHIGEDSEQFAPPRKRIAGAAGVSVKTVDRCTMALERMQLLHIEKRGDEEYGQQSNAYVLVEPVTGGGVTESRGGASQSRPLKEELLPKKNPSKGSPDEIEQVWASYVATMKPRRTTLDSEGRKVIRDALAVADAGELETAIKACERSDYHMKRGVYAKGGVKERKGRKYNALSAILVPKKSKRETQRERIDFWLERASDGTGQEVKFDQDRHREELKEAQGIK